MQIFLPEILLTKRRPLFGSVRILTETLKFTKKWKKRLISPRPDVILWQYR